MPRSTGFLVVFALLAVSLLGAATPMVGPQKRIDIAGGTAAANETSGAASDANPNEIIAGWNDWRASPVGQEIIRGGAAVSQDGGDTWVDFVVRPPASHQSGVEGDPMTGFDNRTGNLWYGAISFGSPGGLYVARKNPGDSFFQPSVMVDTSGGVDKCWIVAGRNNITANSTRVYVAYNFGIVQSDNLGDTWSNPTSLGSGLGFLPRIGPNGEVYVSYWSFSGNSFSLKRSLNGGGSFETFLIANRMDSWGTETFNSRFPGTMRVPALPALAVDPDNGRLYSVFPDTTEVIAGQANVDVYFTTSDDRGETWTTPVILNGEGPFVGDQFFPWIEVDPTGRVHVLFLDSRNTDQNDNVTDGMIDAYYMVSEDEGDTWTEVRLTETSFNTDDDGLDRSSQFWGDYLGMAVTSTTAWPIYPDSRNGDTDTYTNEITFCQLPGEVSGLTVDISEDGSTLDFNFNDVADSDDYVLLQNLSPDGIFGIEIATGPDGATGVQTPTPFFTSYYLVSARNACGVGPN